VTADDEIREAARLRKWLDAVEDARTEHIRCSTIVERRAAPEVLTHPGDAPHLVRGDLDDLDSD